MEQPPVIPPKPNSGGRKKQKSSTGKEKFYHVRSEGYQLVWRLTKLYFGSREF